MFIWTWRNIVWGLIFVVLSILSFIALLVGPDPDQITWRPIGALIEDESND
jgi:hypothetical protein